MPAKDRLGANPQMIYYERIIRIKKLNPRRWRD